MLRGAVVVKGVACLTWDEYQFRMIFEFKNVPVAEGAKARYLLSVRRTWVRTPDKVETK